MDDPKKNPGRKNPGAGGPQGIGVPAKGDSTPSQVPLDPLDGATISDVPLRPTPKPPSKPPAKTPAPPVTRVAGPDLTLAESIPGGRSTSGSFSGTYVPEIILNPGDVIGARYELLEMLGEGGMGAVFKAHDLEIDRFVALKVIRPELARNPAILARFKQELANRSPGHAQKRHPHLRHCGSRWREIHHHGICRRFRPSPLANGSRQIHAPSRPSTSFARPASLSMPLIPPALSIATLSLRTS